MDEVGPGRFSRRTKTLDVTPLPDGSMSFLSWLKDESFGGSYEDPDQDAAVIHHFVIEGRATGDDLVLESLSVRAEEHPFPQCPFIIPMAEQLVGKSLMSGWRQSVLDRFRGSAGCTHVTTLLLGLSEVTTLIYFQRMNQLNPYGPKTQASGEWIAGSLDLAPKLVGACHTLSEGSPVLKRAEGHRARRDAAAPEA